MRQDVTRVDSTLDPQFAYAQVLASTAGEHGILDVLSATRAGRLAILELKTVEHPVFLLQVAKYWQRISACGISSHPHSAFIPQRKFFYAT